MRAFILLVLSGLIAAPALAADFTKISERAEFLALIEGHQLRLSTWDVTLNVQPDGQIVGNMLGWDVTGSWKWQDGYFCRQMDWSGYEIEYNCQLVEANGTKSLRFTVDQGAGKSATFALR
jgi:hypothetical protein